MNVKHNKEEVLRLGLELFFQKGFHALGVDEICKVTGMTKGAFYNAFKSKEQFLTEAIQLYGENNVKRIQSVFQQNQGLVAIERLELFYIKMLSVQPKVNFKGCFINNMMAELGATNEAVRNATEREFYKFIDSIEPTVAEAQEQGDLNPSIPARELTELIHTTFYGILTIAKSSQQEEHGITTIQLLFNNLKPKKNESSNNN